MSRHFLCIAFLAGAVMCPSLGRCCSGPETLFEWSANSASENEAKSGDEEPLQSDRPGFGDCPSTVGCDRCQLEVGYQYSYDHHNNTSEIVHTYPQPLVRIGELANWFEFRVSWSIEQDTDRVFGVSSHTAVGSQDLDVGFKIALTAQDGWLPKTGLVVDAFVPSGSPDFTADKFLPEVEYIYEWEIGKDLTIDALTILSDAADDVTGNAYLSVSQAVGAQEKLTEKLSGYVQWHVTSPDGADTVRTQQVFESGFILLVTNNLQLDAESGVGLNSVTPDYFVGTGLCIRR
ncbi:MAG TPA: transporter [Lacipirellulaceae bacterium]|jgi:hypothetical protein|nr:transporter [Lacipirellulaceae bacterium]